jgi:hypothetical protein
VQIGYPLTAGNRHVKIFDAIIEVHETLFQKKAGYLSMISAGDEYPSCPFIPVSEATGRVTLIHIGPELLTYLDQSKRAKFLRTSRKVKTSRRTGGVGRNNRREMTNAGFDL